MAFETVTGWCWPQSVAPGGRVALHLSWAGALPVDVEVARVGREREVVHAETGVPAGDHPTPNGAAQDGCGWPAAAEIAVGDQWRSGYYEVVLEIDVAGK
ncbi:MAG: hypothetical protein ACJ739_04995, partial [Acidimicrobiales bacterium]